MFVNCFYYWDPGGQPLVWPQSIERPFFLGIGLDSGHHLRAWNLDQRGKKAHASEIFWDHLLNNQAGRGSFPLPLRIKKTGGCLFEATLFGLVSRETSPTPPFAGSNVLHTFLPPREPAAGLWLRSRGKSITGSLEGFQEHPGPFHLFTPGKGALKRRTSIWVNVLLRVGCTGKSE